MTHKPWSRLYEDQPQYADGSVRVGGPYVCFACGATSAEQWLDPIYDSTVPGQIKHACHDVMACAHRSVLVAMSADDGAS